MRITVEELLQRYAAGERDFIGVDLRDAELRGINLSRANLSGADLIGVDFSGYGFGQKIGSIHSNLSDAILVNTNLSWANLKFVDFSRSDLSGSDLTFADLGSAILDDSILIGTNFTAVKGSFSIDGSETGYDLES
ncbi:Pentapeptide repeat-containing protein [Nostoc sp. DSM 114160]|jgi:uncharacterized protein YjbI with pentapeptide repeats